MSFDLIAYISSPVPVTTSNEAVLKKKKNRSAGCLCARILFDVHVVRDNVRVTALFLDGME